MSPSDVAVSVLLTTYDHEAYIAQALDSVLMQRTDFAWELLVGEDCSTDGTRDAVLDYAKRWPERIRVFLQEANQGGHANFARLLRAARGRYLAWLEGDDYWTDPEKLRKQVEYLEAHPDVVLCFHRAMLVNEGDAGREPRASNRRQAPLTTIRDICRGNYIHTASTMFRSGVVEDLPEWFYSLPTGDWPLFVLLAQHGSIGFLDEVMCVYRKHGAGYWTKRSRREKRADSVQVAQVLLRHVERGFAGSMNAGYVHQCRKALRVAMREGDLRGMARYLSKTALGVARQPLRAREARLAGRQR
jgi:glycosyltransferase involved in cell wall biosynthesis